MGINTFDCSMYWFRLLCPLLRIRHAATHLSRITCAHVCEYMWDKTRIQNRKTLKNPMYRRGETGWSECGNLTPSSFAIEHLASPSSVLYYCATASSQSLSLLLCFNCQRGWLSTIVALLQHENISFLSLYIQRRIKQNAEISLKMKKKWRKNEKSVWKVWENMDIRAQKGKWIIKLSSAISITHKRFTLASVPNISGRRDDGWIENSIRHCRLVRFFCVNLAGHVRYCSVSVITQNFQ